MTDSLLSDVRETALELPSRDRVTLAEQLREQEDELERLREGLKEAQLRLTALEENASERSEPSQRQFRVG